jgi:ketosteroid isomerase-like protein
LAEVRALAEGGEHLTSEFLGDRELEDGRVLSLGRSTIRRAAGDLRTEFAVLYTLAGGKVTAVAHYPTHAEAFENLGIEP